MKEFDGYYYLGDLVEEMRMKKRVGIDDYIVHFEMKHKYQKEYLKYCTIFKVTYEHGRHYSYFEDDWWKGEEDIRLIGITPMSYLPDMEPYFKKEEDEDDTI